MRAHRLFVSVLTALLLSLLQRAAFALPGLLVLQAEEQKARPSLIEALRVQLREVTDVETSAESLAAEPAALRIGRAAQIATAAHASFAVWLEAVPELDGAPGFLLYVVGGESGRAVVQVVRLPAAKDGPDVDRSLALKVSEIVESALRPAQPELSAALQPALAPAPAKPAPSVAVAPARRARADSLGLLLGGIATSPAGDAHGQVGFRFGLGYTFRTSPVELEWDASAHLLSALDIQQGDRQAKIAEQVVAVDFAVRTRARFAFGAELGTALRILHADGFVGSTETRSSRLLVPVLRLGPELRAGLTEQTALTLSAGGEWMPIRQRLSLAGAPLGELGRARADARISLIISLR